MVPRLLPVGSMTDRFTESKRRSPTERLMGELVAGNGVLDVPPGPMRSKYEARVRAAVRFGKVPKGKRLVIEGGGWARNCTIRLEDAVHEWGIELAPGGCPVHRGTSVTAPCC